MQKIDFSKRSSSTITAVDFNPYQGEAINMGNSTQNTQVTSGGSAGIFGGSAGIYGGSAG